MDVLETRRPEGGPTTRPQTLDVVIVNYRSAGILDTTLAVSSRFAGGSAQPISPKPDVPPHSYVGWPLWFVGQAFVHTRRAGALLIFGLLLNAFLPVKLPWL